MQTDVSGNCPSCFVRLNAPEESTIGCISGPACGPSCEACTEVQAMESGISSAEKGLHALRCRLAERKRRQNEQHSPIISRLLGCPEIMSEIFERCRFYAPTELLSKWEPQKPLDNGNRRQSTCPLRLGAVCSHWRDAAWSTPRLWDTIRIRLTNDPITESDIWVIDEWLRRSGQLPLTITIGPQEGHSRTLAYKMPDIDELCEVVNRYSDRWQVLSLEIPGSLFSKFCGNFSGESILDTLFLRNIDPKVEPTRFRIQNATPEPRNVSIHGVSINLVDLNPDNLRCLDMVAFELNDLLQLLPYAPALKRCKLGDGMFFFEPPIMSRLSSTVIVTHPCLEELEVSLSYFPIRLLDAISLPALDRLTWHVSPTLPVVKILSMLRRSSCTLTELNLAECNMTDILFPLLEQIPSLQYLFISGGVEQTRYRDGTSGRKDKFFDLLAETSIRSAIGPGFLPNLQSLRLGKSDDTDWWTCLPAIFGPISDIDNTNRRPLRSLRIDWVPRDILAIVTQREILESFVPFLEAGFTIRFDGYMGDAVKEAIKRHNLMEPVNAIRDFCPPCLSSMNARRDEDKSEFHCETTGRSFCEGCADISCIERRIAAMEHGVSELQRRLKKQQNLQRSLINSRLLGCPEVIFTFLTNPPTGWTITSSSPHARAHCMITEGSMIGAVCSLWRQIGLSTAGLWNTIRIHVNGTGITTPRLELIDVWLRRSGQLPLSITIYEGRRGSPYYYGFSSNAMPDLNALCKMINQYSHRWQDLCLVLPGSLFSKFQGNSSSESILRTLVLNNTGKSGEVTQFSITNVRPAPKIFSIHSIEMARVDIDLNKIESLEIFGFGLRELLDILPQLGELKQCTLYDNSSGSGGPIYSPPDIITLPRIEELNVEVSRFPLRLLNAVTLPGLRRLRWTAFPMLPIHPILSMIERSSCTLTELVLVDCKATEIILPLLKGIPSLQHLGVVGGRADGRFDKHTKVDMFFHALSSTATSEADRSPFLPVLQSLRLTMSDDTDWWQLVPAIFGPLSDDENLHRRPLRSLIVDGMPDRIIAFATKRDRLELLVPFLEAGFTIRYIEKSVYVDFVEKAIKYHGLVKV
ncbi:hypothetical protein CVT26_015088 [Gymnopilus dilepis]|uniref:Uncharacterized protein n=1 Tax=Gymnopilus dilepis TaxID=231916 RepID=A0A409YEP7_9AGAR|nr:hypothetical protein CVT26_015088 [Gymnopilus dilepis]